MQDRLQVAITRDITYSSLLAKVLKKCQLCAKPGAFNPAKPKVAYSDDGDWISLLNDLTVGDMFAALDDTGRKTIDVRVQ